MRRLPCVALISATVLVLAWTGRARGQSYAFSCRGQQITLKATEVAGVISFTSQTQAIGFAVQSSERNGAFFVNHLTLAGTFTNGNAGPQGGNGNGIPNGCFEADISVGAAITGVLTHLFGCYTTTGFYAIQRDRTAQINCQAQVTALKPAG